MPASRTKPTPKRKRPTAPRATSYKLAAEDDAFIRAKVASGMAANASQVVRAAMREYRVADDRRAALRVALERGMDSPVDPRSVDAIFDEIEAEVFGAAKKA